MIGRRHGTVTAFRLAVLAMLLAAASGAVTYEGQLRTYGRLLPGFLGFETVTVLVLAIGVAGLRSSRRWARSAAQLIAAVAALWMVGVAVSMIGELLAGATEPWLPLDSALTGASGCAWGAAAVVGWIEDHHPRQS